MKQNDRIFYIAVILASVLFLFVGNRIARGEAREAGEVWVHYVGIGTVTEIIERDGHIDDYGRETVNILFEARMRDGGRRGETIRYIRQDIGFFRMDDREVSEGDRVQIVYDEWNGIYFFDRYVRINYIFILGGIFLALVILFGRKKGFNAIVALGFTCAAVFLVFIPAILSGRNPYATTLIVSAFAIVSTLLIVIGPNKKAVSAMLGCFGGVLLSGLLMFVMSAVMRLTPGIEAWELTGLWDLPTENPISLRAVIFAGVILGAVGAIMDVAMSISSSLWELKEVGGVSDFRGFLKSGINIGRDILGTMLNTLILAYIGSSLSIILLITAAAPNIMEILNSEMIIEEFLRALMGSFGMLLTIPLTAAICGWLYSLPGGKDEPGEINVDAYFGAKKSKLKKVKE